MEEERLDSWEEFVKAVERLRANTNGNGAYLLFRGQANAHWKLETTWERGGYPNIPIRHYLSDALIVKDEVEILTNQKWSVSPEELNKPFSSPDLLTRFLDAPIHGFDYLSYLRQHGFPSPLLDWTRSIFIAAFFTFQNIVEKGDDAAIYVLDARGPHLKSAGAFPSIFRFGARNGGHRRHFMQQGEYTICVHWQKHESWGEHLWHIASHDISITESGKLQDNQVIKKFILPSKERLRVLDILNEQNINAYTLFGTEEGIMQTLANRQFSHYLRPKPSVD